MKVKLIRNKTKNNGLFHFAPACQINISFTLQKIKASLYSSSSYIMIMIHEPQLHHQQMSLVVKLRPRGTLNLALAS